MRTIAFISGLIFLPPLGMYMMLGQSVQDRLAQLKCYSEVYSKTHVIDHRMDVCDLKHGNLHEKILARLRNR